MERRNLGAFGGAAAPAIAPSGSAPSRRAGGRDRRKCGAGGGRRSRNGARRWEIENLAAMLPGETSVDLKGTLSVEPAPSFRGHARRGIAPSARLRVMVAGRDRICGEDRPLRGGGRYRYGAATASSSPIIARDDRRRLDEGLDRYPPLPAVRPALRDVDLAADRADLAESERSAELFMGKTADAGKVDQMTLSLRADSAERGRRRGEIRSWSRAAWRPASSSSAGSPSPTWRAPRSKRAAGYGSASEFRPGRIEASVKAEDFRARPNSSPSFVPESPAARHLRAVAPSLSPIKAEVSAESGGRGEIDWRSRLTGSFADTHVTLEVDRPRQRWPIPQVWPGGSRCMLDGEDSAGVLRQIGLSPLPVRVGTADARREFDGAVASAGKLNVERNGRRSRFDYHAETRSATEASRSPGRLKAESKDIDPVLLLAGIAVPGCGGGPCRLGEGPAGIFGWRRQSGDSTRIVRGPAGRRRALRRSSSSASQLSGALELEYASLPFLASLRGRHRARAHRRTVVADGLRRCAASRTSRST